ncbi:oligosaccharide flippase family protein [Methanocella conradii]|uniref:oligosaccharide flippase family protein n=1 Tax=Methanocella conradii TaxID=1175444 RepID=UPI00157DFB82
MFCVEKYYREPLYRNSIAIMLNTVVGSFFGLLFWIAAARTMPSRDIGLATAVISASTLIVTLSRLGMDSGLIRFLPASKDKDGFYSSTLIITLIASILLTITFLIGLDWFSPSLSFIREGLFPLIIIIFIALMSLNGIQYTTFIALRRGGISFINNLLLGLRIPALYFLAFLRLLGIFSAFEVAYLITFIFGVYMINRLGVKFKFKLSVDSIKESFLFSLGNYTAGIFSMIAITIIPILIVNLIGAENCAYFYVAYSVSSLLFMIPGATSTSLFVEGSHDFPLKENVWKSLKFCMILLMPSMIIIFLFGDKILLLFSTEFSEQSFELLKLLAISSLFSTIVSVYTTIKRIQKEIRIINYINIISSIMLISTGSILMLKYGLIGIGYAWIISNMIVSIGILILMIKKEKWFDGLKTMYKVKG